MKILDMTLFSGSSEQERNLDAARSLRNGVATDGKGNRSEPFDDGVALDRIQREGDRLVHSLRQIYMGMMAEEREKNKG